MLMMKTHKSYSQYFILISFIALVLFISFDASAAGLMSPIGGSNKSRWDSLMGNGSFDFFSTSIRVVSSVVILMIMAWIFNGIYQAGIVDGSITKRDCLFYFLRASTLLTFGIFIFNL